MSLMKYGIYIGIILIVAFFFEQIMTGLYDLTLQGVAGEINAYIILVVAWIAIYVLARAVLDKKVHPKSSRFAFWGGMLHIGVTLAVFFAYSNPLLLLIFPVFLSILFLTRQKRQTAPRFAGKFRPMHPLFIDDRGGVCVSRIGKEGFLLLKFLQVQPPLPIREVLLYLYHEGVEFTFELQHQGSTSYYYLGIITQGRRFDAAHQLCLARANAVRQFFKKMGVVCTDVSDYLNVLQIFYGPYFLYSPAALTPKGLPRQFLTLSTQGSQVLIENELEELPVVLHKLAPTFTKTNGMYAFLESVSDSYYLQFHLRPLDAARLASLEEQHTTDYRATLKRLTTGLEENSEFQAASYLFNQIEPSQENLEPLMDRTELDRLKSLKQQLTHLQEARSVGMWDTGFYLCGSLAVTQTLAVKIGGEVQPLAPYALPSLVSRWAIEANHPVDSKAVSMLFPNITSATTEPLEPSINESV